MAKKEVSKTPQRKRNDEDDRIEQVIIILRRFLGSFREVKPKAS